MSIRELHEKLAQGWTFQEARMGKGWEAKYPNIATWPGCYTLFGSGGVWRISLEAGSGPWFHSTQYILAETESSDPDQYRAVDEAIKSWCDEHGQDAILRFEQSWMGQPGWETRYPHIAYWTSHGKRFCIQIKINLVTGQAYTKAWHYDKPSNTETVLFEQEMQDKAEPDVLATLDAGIKTWLGAHGPASMLSTE